MKWINLEPDTQNKVSQKEKEKYHILTHIYGIQKDDIDEFICKAALEKQIQRADLWTWGKEEERVRYMERVTWKLILLCEKQIANGNLLYDSGNSNKGSVNLEGWVGEGDGREVHEGGDICTPMADSC